MLVYFNGFTTYDGLVNYRYKDITGAKWICCWRESIKSMNLDETIDIQILI
ncbi:hypothetical protein O2K51_09835 [Apibacter raozihei]|uniref:hypothetical protein n=1 Tax=Apibacter raozihei TaxID=2500547 RepID=UPI0013E3D85A|nr:hypothetical protein [Apibacter raozihei]